MIKLANPLEYPLAVLIGGVVLVVGVRFLGLPNLIILPSSLVVATGGAMVLKSREPDEDKMARKQLEQELKAINILSEQIAKKAVLLQQEAENLLTHSDFQLELLIAVQSACNYAIELPQKIEEMGKKISYNESLLSLEDLNQQLQEVRSKKPMSSGVNYQQLEKLEASLNRNIELAKTGKDTRNAQLLSLRTLIQDSAGTLQQLQNKLRNADLDNSQELQELNQLSEELKHQQEQVNILIH